MIDAEVDDGETPVGRSHGWVSAGNGEGGVAASVRKFVQQWPKGFSADAGSIVLDLWPDAAGRWRFSRDRPSRIRSSCGRTPAARPRRGFRTGTLRISFP